jgi:hypothetical protein
MIDSFSPLSRKLIAVGLLLLKLLMLISFVIVPTFEWTKSHVDQLSDSRLKLARISALDKAQIVQPETNVPDTLLFKAKSMAEAQSLFDAHLRRSAELNGIKDIFLEAETGAKVNGLLRSKFRVSGPEYQVASIISELESNAPLLRMDQWTLRRDSEGIIALEASMVAGWQQ